MRYQVRVFIENSNTKAVREWYLHTHLLFSFLTILSFPRVMLPPFTIVVKKYKPFFSISPYLRLPLTRSGHYNVCRSTTTWRVQSFCIKQNGLTSKPEIRSKIVTHLMTEPNGNVLDPCSSLDNKLLTFIGNLADRISTESQLSYRPQLTVMGWLISAVKLGGG